MSETEESANLSAAKVEASDEPTVNTTTSSGDNGESAEAQNANAADVNTLQNTSAGLRVTSSAETAPSVSPAADLSSNERQNAPTQPAGENLMIDFSAFLNDIDVQQIGTKCDTNQPIGAKYDICETLENLNLNEEQLEVDSGTSKDDLVGKGASSQSDIKSDETNNAK